MRKGIEIRNDMMDVCTGSEDDYKQGGIARLIPDSGKFAKYIYI